MNTSSLRSRHVVVLGGTSGIGLATARAAAEAGAVVTVVSSNPASVEKALAELPEGAHGHAVDLTDAAAVDRMFARLVAEVGPVDHLAYTAGEPLALMSLDELDVDRARQFFELRYFGALGAVRAAAPHLSDGGSVTLTTGTASARPGPGWSVAASICGATEALTRALAVELAPRRIRVNAVAPGVVRSPLWASMPEADREQLYRQSAASVPLGRVGEVDDVASAYLFTMVNPFTTGTVLTVDGGSVLA
ncbi:SDR family oxidoreductase [Micromonospora sp. ZYX-F-536]|uniref:SDR family oxidoreductase n=1 Tax=Micromonospora sp. ZYX-F-536 TaxID=3457629 RepID=UPI0040407683